MTLRRVGLALLLALLGAMAFATVPGRPALAQPSLPMISITCPASVPAIAHNADRIGAVECTLSASSTPTGSISVKYRVRGAGGRSLQYEQSVDVTGTVTKVSIHYLLDTTTVTVSLLQGSGYTLGNPGEAPIAVGYTPLPQTGLEVNESGAFEGYLLLTAVWHNRFYLVDNEGREAYRWDKAGTFAKLLADGKLLAGHTGTNISEIKPDGTTAYEYPTDTWHHDVVKLSNGNYLFIDSAFYTNAESIAAGANPACLGQKGLEVDRVVEVRPTGTSGGVVVWEWKVWDHLIQDHDSTKANYGVVAGHPERIDLNYGLCRLKDSSNAYIVDPHHLTHLNSIDYNAALDQILITSRHFSEAWIIDHSTTKAQAAGSAGGNSGIGGDLLYRYGNPRAYKNGTKADQKLFFPHNAHWIPSGLPGAGNVLIYNNGYEHPGFRRSHTTVDEVVFPCLQYKCLRAGGAFMPPTAVWTYRLAEPTAIMANAQRLPNGNTLITEGNFTRISEVTQSGSVVWHYTSPLMAGTNVLSRDDSPDGVAVYRTYKYASDHPGIQALSLIPESHRQPIEKAQFVPQLKLGTIQTLFAPNTAATGAPAHKYMNDHAVYRDVKGKWHVIGVANTVTPGTTQGENQFAHGVADTLLGPYTRKPDIDPTGPNTWAFAPHIITYNQKAYMFYGPRSWGLATSSDMDTWTNQTLNVTYPAHASITDSTTPRDAMVLEDGGTYYKYVTSLNPSASNQNVVDVLRSTDLINWTYVDHALTLSGDAVQTAWSTAESPFVVKYRGLYYLFVTITNTNPRNDNYHQTLVFRSDDPTDFGDFNGEKVNPQGAQLVTELPVHAPEVVLDPSNNKWYITTTGWDPFQRYAEAEDGVAIIEMEWVAAPANETPISNTEWTLHKVSSQNSDHPGSHAFDRDPKTYWESGGGGQPHTLDINLGAIYDLNGFVYVPEPHGSGGGISGVITGYKFYVSADGTNWGDPVASGAFDNSIINNNARKLVTFSKKRGQYIRFVSTAAVGGSVSRVQDLGVLGSYVSGPTHSTNRPPTVSAPIADAAIVNETGTHEASLAGVFHDADDDALTVTAVSSNDAVATVSVSADYATLTVSALARGTATVTVTADDGNDGTVEDSFTVRVKAAPQVASAIGDVSGLTVATTRDVSLSAVFRDADGDSLTITAVSSNNATAAVTVAADRSKLTVEGVAEGTATVTVTAEDPDGNTVSDRFAVTVGAPANNPPTVEDAIGDAAIVNETGTHEASLAGVFDDADDDALTVTAVSSNDAVATVSVSADYATLTVSAQARGTATVTVTADDGNGGTVEDSFTVRVKAAPEVASAIGDVSGLKAATTRDISLSEVFRDADGDSLTITAASSNNAIAGVAVSADQTRLTVEGAAQGTATVTVTAEDPDGNRVSDAFQVEVVRPPESEEETPEGAPRVVAPVADFGLEGSRVRDIDLTEVFSDPDGQELIFSAKSSNYRVAGLWNIEGLGGSTLRVVATGNGTATVTVTAEDPDGNQASVYFVVTVTPFSG